MTLRGVLLAVALAACGGGAVARIAGHDGAMPVAIWGAVVTAAVLLERWRYRTRAGAGQQDWQATDEQFIDPESGHPLQVFYNPRTGERRYQRAPHD